ncbi:MAG: FAD-binding oxidoreductase [Nitrososphaerota archaeon]|nr:FAD-binding oxidoreductase [Nitrososphaerota archaeon]
MKDVTRDIIESLSKIVGKEDVVIEESGLQEYAKPVLRVDPHDYDYKVYSPKLAVRPESTEEVSKIVSFASSNKIPIYVQSGGTDTAGGSAPVDQAGIMIDLQKMRNIIELDADSMFVTVQGGVVLKELDEILKEKNLTHGHRPQTYSAASVAGTISHYGVGQESSGFGLLADNVLGITVVLSKGEILKIRSVPKSSMGEKNLLWLFLAGHGQNGIITDVTIRLQPYFEENRRVLLVAFPSFEEAVKASFEISRKGFKPTMQTARDRSIADQRNPMPSLASFDKVGATMTLIIDGPTRAISEIQEAEIMMSCESLGGRILPEQVVNEFLASRDINQDPKQIRDHLGERSKIKPVEWSVWTSFLKQHNLIEFLEKAPLICAKHQMMIRNRSFSASPMTAIISLAPQANHQKDAEERLTKCRYEMIRLAQDLGGTAASFHSSMTMYSSVMEDELGHEGWEVMKMIKRAVDPEITFCRGQADWK